MQDITLYDLMANDIDVWIGKNDKFGFDLEIEINNEFIVNERGVNPAAAESLADFCRRYLAFYDKAASQEDE